MNCARTNNGIDALVYSEVSLVETLSIARKEKMNIKFEKLGKLNAVFTPSAAIMIQDLFSGRSQQLSRVYEAILEKGQHIVLYGERGVGKTSLANIINLMLQGNLNNQSGSHSILCAKVSCDPTETFSDIWRKAFKKISITLNKAAMGIENEVKTETYSLDKFLPQQEVKPSDVVSVLESLDRRVFLIFDEFDTLVNSDIKSKFAYTIKALSDNLPHVTILIVGVAENVNSLIGEHQSLERCIKQVFLPRMSKEELEPIIDKGINYLNMSIDQAVKEDIVNFSQGFPQYTHLLSKYAAKTAIELDSDSIERAHFDLAVDEAIANAQESITNCYQKAINVNRQSHISYREVVLAAALAEDKFPSQGFKVSDLQSTLGIITNKKLKAKSSNYGYYLDELCKAVRGEILRKVGSSNKYRYKFKSPLVKAFVGLKVYQLANKFNTR